MTLTERIDELTEYWSDQLESANLEIAELKHRVIVLEGKVNEKES